MSKLFLTENTFRRVRMLPMPRKWSGRDDNFRYVVAERTDYTPERINLRDCDPYMDNPFDRANQMARRYAQFEVHLDIDGVTMSMHGDDFYTLMRKLQCVDNTLNSAMLGDYNV